MTQARGLWLAVVVDHKLIGTNSSMLHISHQMGWGQ